MIPSSNEKVPDHARWALQSRTLCNQEGYLRPCQTRDTRALPPGLVPLAELCVPEREMVIVIDDDHDLLSEMVEMVERQGYNVIGLSSARELQDVVQKFESGCILLDIRMPGQDGLSVQEWLNSIACTLPVIFISGISDIPTVVQCMKAGAMEFLPKPFAEIALRRAVDSAIGLSRQRNCRRASQQMVGELVSTLTATETVVARMIACGYPTKLIATELGRSENTIKIHRHRIFSKLKVGSAASVGNLINHAHSTLTD